MDEVQECIFTETLDLSINRQPPSIVKSLLINIEIQCMCYVWVMCGGPIHYMSISRRVSFISGPGYDWNMTSRQRWQPAYDNINNIFYYNIFGRFNMSDYIFIIPTSHFLKV